MASSDKHNREQSSNALLFRTVLSPVIGPIIYHLFGRRVWGHGPGKVTELFTNVGCCSSRSPSVSDRRSNCGILKYFVFILFVPLCVTSPRQALWAEDDLHLAEMYRCLTKLIRAINRPRKLFVDIGIFYWCGLCKNCDWPFFLSG